MKPPFCVFAFLHQGFIFWVVAPSETTSEEKSSRSYWGFVLVGAVVIVAAAFIFWPRAGGRQHLSLTVHGCRTNFSAESLFINAGSVSTRSNRPALALVAVTNNTKQTLARVAVTNNTNQTLVLGDSGRSWPVHFYVLGQGGSGWKRQPGGLFLWEGRMPPSKLLPGQGFTVQAAIPTERPCKVSLDYLNDGLSGRIWQKLPSRLAAKLSWASPWRTATTEVIDPSKSQ